MVRGKTVAIVNPHDDGGWRMMSNEEGWGDDSQAGIIGTKRGQKEVGTMRESTSVQAEGHKGATWSREKG
ncbi:hypothetical protein PoB_001131800 [Plakobranchus ocellatus]|uniref:Uncharacterized protein n=1 Tax=Plakobranchus ocellatus TaxID=259542 RepID=A0AAV3YQJ4_9GAST|nr:hypothetical protein PoB_001131800 [Plakobranchus ocellatus]